MPGPTDEIQGVADSLALPFEKALFCAAIGATIGAAGGAEIGPATLQDVPMPVALPAITADHLLYVARNYDMGLADADLRLCTTRIQGRLDHLGFSDMLSGPARRPERARAVRDPLRRVEPDARRLARAPWAPLCYRRAQRPRSLPDLEEAIDLWQRMPIGSTGIFLVADRLSAAALIQIAGRRRAVRRIGPATDQQSWSQPTTTHCWTFPTAAPTRPGEPMLWTRGCARTQDRSSERPSGLPGLRGGPPE